MMKRHSLVVLFMVLAVFAFAAGSTEVVEPETPEEPWGGETEIVVYTTMYTEFIDAMKEGYPVDFVFPEDGSQIYDNAMALVRGAKHPNLAHEFIDYIFSDDMQLRGSEFLYIPIKTGLVDPSLPNNLESLLADIGTIYSPDIALNDENRTLIQDTFGEYIRTKGLK